MSYSGSLINHLKCYAHSHVTFPSTVAVTHSTAFCVYLYFCFVGYIFKSSAEYELLMLSSKSHYIHGVIIYTAQSRIMASGSRSDETRLASESSVTSQLTSSEHKGEAGDLATRTAASDEKDPKERGAGRPLPAAQRAQRCMVG
jgi:hypothetical protein